MGFKTGLIVGLGVGYVLGAKAGRERYDQLKETWDELSDNPRLREAIGKGRGAVGSGMRAGLHAVEGGVEKAAGAVRKRLGEEGEPEAQSEPSD